MKLVKVLNSKAAEKIVALGYSYMNEYHEDKEVWVFVLDEKIEEYLHQNYSLSDYAIDNRLHF